MANFYGHARSNYFKVKDLDAFKDWVETCPSLGYWEKGGLVAIYSDCPDSGCWPSCRYGEDDEFEDLNLLAELAEHLTEDSVAVLIEAGAEKLRYITGYANAVNHEGEVVTVSLDEIYQRAFDNFKVMPSVAEY
jgi:hypothetical protein